ncbi:aminodeoxychorismate synthase component I [Paludisphaera rhizosphaerae]|uniref:aminodeoxychorismate synthase component I n=1 Tax=Paludisphaera rhizosphaerae TaxID=2711216 RepID=UPI0013EDC5CF|nr:aminodeoxychorismate synthase component I [Paludisphaera rhizosphaerae]
MGTTQEPTSVRIPLDLPVDRLTAAVGCWPEPAILAGGAGFGEAGRWSVLSAYPRLVFESIGPRWSIRTDAGHFMSGDGPMARLDTLAREFRLAEPADPFADDPDACPFRGGLIGFFGYDLAPALERLPRKAARDSKLPDVRMALHDTAVLVDERTGAAAIHAWDLLGEGRTEVERRARFWRRAIKDAAASPRPLGTTQLGSLTSNFTRDEYLTALRRTLDYIEAGDVFQINLSQRFSAHGKIDPLELFLRLRRESPAPFSAFLRWRDLAVVSASPEWFYQTRGDWIATRPIKGTRPRGATPEEDDALAAELQSSAKDRAELTMIVDLERNDLGRVCQFGSVQVVEAMKLETYAQVHHLVATVEGRLRPDVGPIDVVRATFPGGSITGAPKIRAMEIIDELEPTRRSLYTGAIGYLSRGGTSGFNIAIRTALVEGDRVSYQVGGGIVADSVPEAEYEETLHKGRGIRRVLTGEDAR